MRYIEKEVKEHNREFRGTEFEFRIGYLQHEEHTKLGQCLLLKDIKSLLLKILGLRQSFY
jgi:hypothetical protein